MDALPWLLLLGDVFAMALSPVPSTNTDLMALRDMAQAFDGLIVDAGPRGPLHDGERLRSWARALDVFEHAGKPVVLAVDGVCPEDIEVATLERLGVLDEASAVGGGQGGEEPEADVALHHLAGAFEGVAAMVEGLKSLDPAKVSLAKDMGRVL